MSSIKDMSLTGKEPEMFAKDQRYLMKTAYIMRSGTYRYAEEQIFGSLAKNPKNVVMVIRPAEEIAVCIDIMLEMSKKYDGKCLPYIALHPVSDELDLDDPRSWERGWCEKPREKKVENEVVLECDIWFHESIVDLLEKDIVELSCGWKGSTEVNEVGQYIQRIKSLNHVALVPDGRAGRLCSMKDKGVSMAETHKEAWEALEKAVTELSKIEKEEKIGDEEMKTLKECSQKLDALMEGRSEKKDEEEDPEKKDEGESEEKKDEEEDPEKKDEEEKKEDKKTYDRAVREYQKTQKLYDCGLLNKALAPREALGALLNFKVDSRNFDVALSMGVQHQAIQKAQAIRDNNGVANVQKINDKAFEKTSPALKGALEKVAQFK